MKRELPGGHEPPFGRAPGRRPFVVGIAGGTASGKTSLAELLVARTGASLVTHDRYYRDADASTNFDHPDSLDTARLVEDLDRLRAGQPADLPVYYFPTHKRLPATERLTPGPLLVVEGILVLAEPALRARFDLCVFVHAAADVRLVRRVRRDILERGRDLESVLGQYLATVRPMHEAYVEPSAAHATLRLDGERALEGELSRLLAALPI
ncbi:MAG: uridine kinase [Pseudomonadota bacterium]|nr:uridine kinase [Pseudomonadota bacterium]